MNMTPAQMQTFLTEAIKGMAIVQARQEAMECILKALITEVPPLHPLIWQVLNAAQSDLAHRGQQSRPENPPEADAAALQLLNVLRSVCAPPATPGTAG